MPTASSRACAVCGAPLDQHRRDATCCCGACRAEASRLNRLLRGETVDGYGSIAERLSVAQKRTQRRGFRYIEGASK